MAKEKPLILITNDDGVDAKGIKELIGCLRDLGELVVVAPDGPRSGMSSAITSTIPIKYRLLSKEDDLTIYSCTGTPVDCVKLAIGEMLDRKPDLLVSGINHGTNVAVCVHYSGTLGAAAEGSIFGVPSLGVSLTDFSSDADFSESCRFARKLSRRILRYGLPEGTYLNLNVPDMPHVKGMKVSRQAKGKWTNEFVHSNNARNETVYWLSGNFENARPIEHDNDTLALENGYASLVPCKVDVTDYSFLDRLGEIIKD